MKPLFSETENSKPARRILPSEYMRAKRPYLFSDAQQRTAYRLDRAVFQHHLDTLGERKQHTDFEHFARKLCERSFCPNIRPHTGPDGGGDGKTDAESIPVSLAISRLWYIGEPGASAERWAFAFSTEKRWSNKVREDVADIVGAKRDFKRIYCVTSRASRARDRARVEDELSKQYGTPVHVLDRTWIIDRVFEGKLFELAHKYLEIGDLTASSEVLGPNDFSRSQQLENIEQRIADPIAYQGIEYERVVDALEAAKLSRALERPRFETDGRFERAIRLARDFGSPPAELRAHYTYAWTVYWWFDDFGKLHELYDPVQNLVLGSDEAAELEKLHNLFGLLNSAIANGFASADDLKKDEREAILRKELERVRSVEARPTNALRAETYIAMLDMKRAFADRDRGRVPDICERYSAILDRARYLGEYPVRLLEEIIDIFGLFAGDAPEYEALAYRVAEIIGERESEGSQGRILLRLARQQMERDDALAAVRALGKASVNLIKEEYRDDLIEALLLLTRAYVELGLFWIARATCLSALVAAFHDFVQDGDPPVPTIPLFLQLMEISARLGHLPDFLASVEMIRILEQNFSVREERRRELHEDVAQYERAFAGILTHANLESLTAIRRAPDIFEALGLHACNITALYMLGHEATLREEGLIPPEESPEELAAVFARLAADARQANLPSSIITNEGSELLYDTVLLGVGINVAFANSAVGTQFSEAVLSTLEAFAATSLDADVMPHTESFSINIVVSPDTDGSLKVALNAHGTGASIEIPKGWMIRDQESAQRFSEAVLEAATLTYCAIASAPDLEGHLRHLAEQERAVQRAVSFSNTGASYSRLFTATRGTLGRWDGLVRRGYLCLPSRPMINATPVLETGDENGSVDGAPPAFQAPRSHRKMNVASVIDIHLWDKAGWQGVGYLSTRGYRPPVMALMFGNSDVGRAILERWHQRFGSEDADEAIQISIIKGVARSHPYHYRMQISPNPKSKAFRFGSGQLVSFANRVHTLEAETHQSLNEFIQEYERFGCYDLSVMTPEDDPHAVLAWPRNIRKKAVTIVDAWRIGANDTQMMGLLEDDDPIIPDEHQTDAPVIEALKRKYALSER